MRQKTKIISAILLVALLVGVVYAAFFTLNIPSTMNIIAAYGLELRGTEGTLIETYDWGDVHRNDEISMEVDGSTTLTLKNTGDVLSHVKWRTDPLSSPDWKITMTKEGVEWLIGSAYDLDAGAEVSITIKLKIYNTATFGSSACNIIFEAVP